MTLEDLEFLKNISYNSTVSPVRNKKAPLCTCKALIGENVLINGEWYYKVTDYIPSKEGPTVLHLTGAKRVIFDGINFELNDIVYLDWSDTNIYDFSNEYNTNSKDTPFVIEFKNCSGYATFTNFCVPSILVDSNLNEELFLYCGHNSGIFVDIFDVINGAVVYLTTLKKSEDCRATVLKMKISENSTAGIEADNCIIHGLMCDGKLFSSTSKITIKYGFGACDWAFLMCVSDSLYHEANIKYSSNDVNSAAISYLFKNLENHEFKYVSDKTNIEMYNCGRCLEEDIRDDFYVTFEIARKSMKESNSKLIDSGSIF